MRLKVEDFNYISNKTLFNIRQDGISKKVKKENLTCGDIIKLNSGDVVPADIRIINCNNLKVKNNYMSDQNVDSSFLSYPTDENILKSKDILFEGSKIIDGNVSGIVINQGKNTILNQIMNQIKPFFVQNNLSHKYSFTNKFLSNLAAVIYYWIGLSILCIIFLIYTRYIELQLFYVFIGFGITLLTPTIILLVIISLSIAKKSFSNCLFNKPEFVITLGQIDVLVINDVSMLHQNQFIISKVWIDGYLLNGDEVAIGLGENKIHQSAAWTAITRASVLCNEANEHQFEENAIEINRNNNIDKTCGDIDESLLKSFNDCESIQKWGGSLSRYRENNSCLYGPKYDPISKCKLSIHKLNDGDPRLLLIMRGNPLDILKSCGTVLINGKEEDLEIWKNHLIECYENLKRKNPLTVAFCDLRLNPGTFPEEIAETTDDLDRFIPRNGLRFIGIVSFVYSLKPSVAASIKKCEELGLKLIFMAENIETPVISMSKENNIDKFKVLPISIIQSWSGQEFLNVLRDRNLIITHANEKLKRDLIKLCQSKQMRVGVIESNANYSPNLLLANIGIVPQTRSNNICKQFADISVIDDKFEHIIDAIQKSRNLFTTLNVIVNTIHYPKLALIFGFLFFSFLGVPLVINLNFILVLELCLLLPAICLSFEKSEKLNTMIQKQKIIDCGLVIQISSIQLAGAIFSYIVVMAIHGFWPSRLLMIRNMWYSHAFNDLSDSYGSQQTYAQRMNLNLEASYAVFFTIILLQITSIITTRTKYKSIFFNYISNYRLIFSIISCILLVGILIYGLSRLNNIELCYVQFLISLVPLPFAVFLIIFTEIRKFLARRYGRYLEI